MKDVKTNNKSSSKYNRSWQSACKWWVQQINNQGVKGAAEVGKTTVKQIAEGTDCIANRKSSKVPQPKEWPLIKLLIEELLK